MATRLCVAMLLRDSGLMATQQRVAMPPSMKCGVRNAECGVNSKRQRHIV
jgi:hypothetical protein